MKKLLLTTFIGAQLLNVFAQQKTKLQQDKEAIKSMVGCYKVSFDFAETFAPDTGYKYHDRYREWGIEYVFLVEETDKKIVLQHLLIVNDTTIIKHWRQDWVYENTELLSYYKDNQWDKNKLKPEQVKGQWTQKVYQVDDSPRYESTGTWVHVDGRHYWEGTCDAPLPRREFTKRSDYNVMRRNSHMEVTNEGWFLEQDNQKILRANGVDIMLCEEKGMEKFTKGNYNCQVAINWWEKNKNYWADVRIVWEQVFAKYPTLKIEKKIDNTLLWEKLFKLGDEAAKKSGSNKEEILRIIESHLKTA
jgi:hypothetical protein